MVPYHQKRPLGTRNKGLSIIHDHNIYNTHTLSTQLRTLHFYQSFDHVLHHRSQEGLVIGISNGAIGTNLPLIPREHIKLTHLEHSEHKLVKEEALVNGKVGDNALSPRISVKVLVGGEEALAVHEVNVVLVVEGVGGSDVKNGGVVGVGGGARASEVVAEGLVHDGVLGGVEPVGEGTAVADAYGVAT